ncbi:MAG TPA: nucleotide exchange factor GrpE [Thermodesulfobacteriota bacterium]
MEKEEGMEKEEMTEGAEGRIAETPEEEIRRLAEQLEAKSKEASENHDKYLRARAELDNFRKRTEKEKADAISFANESLIEEILPIADNFERALAHANGEENLKSLREGVKLTASQMLAAFKKFGLEEIKALGQKFDPTVHHAISEEESEDAEPGTVVKEFQKGYYLKGRLLRPAMVAVAKRPEAH